MNVAQSILLTIALTLAAPLAQAQTTLKIPFSWKYKLVQGETSKDVYLSGAQLRKILTDKKVDTVKIPDAFTVELGADYNEIHSQVQSLQFEIQQALKESDGVGKGYITNGLFPTEYEKANNKSCYLGNALEVLEIYPRITPVFYTEKSTIIAWKFKSEIGYVYDAQESEEFIAPQSSVWNRWNRQDDAILIIFTTGDEGRDTKEAVIEQCASEVQSPT